MKLRTLVLPLLALAASCSVFSGFGARETLLSTDRVVVSADVSMRGDAWTLRNIEAEVPADSSAHLSAVDVVAFADVDGDDAVDEVERRGSWSVRSSSATRRLAGVGKLRQSSLEDLDPAVWKLEVRVTYADGDASGGDEDLAVVPFTGFD